MTVEPISREEAERLSFVVADDTASSKSTDDGAVEGEWPDWRWSDRLDDWVDLKTGRTADDWAFGTDEPREIRVTDPETGGEKGRKGCEIGFVDPVALQALGRVASKGSEKYAAFNYLRGFAWSLSYNALQRHLMQFWAGEDTDPESGELHVVHAAWHALALVSFLSRGLGTDDRPPTVGFHAKGEQ